MGRRYSPITDLYGIPPEEEPTGKRIHGWLVVLLVLVGVFIYQSVDSVMRLRPDPPPEMIGAGRNPRDEAYGVQVRLARDCWDYAINHLQDEYPYGHSLPRSPTIGTFKPPAIRIACWPGLRRVWTQEDSWEHSYRWSTEWLASPHGFLRRTLRRLWHSLMRGS